MNRIFTLLFASVFVSAASSAQTSENFNSRPGTDLNQLKTFLITNCWQFYGCDINSDWDPAIEGDGALISRHGNCSIYSPAMLINTPITISFSYKFRSVITAQRLFRIWATDAVDRVILSLDNADPTGENNTDVYTYNKTFPAIGSGCYKIWISYGSTDPNDQIAIDQLNFSANTCAIGSCVRPPISINDTIAGAADYSASGNVSTNDIRLSNAPVSTGLVTNSADGLVSLNSSGNFTFTPNAGFTGPSTSFTYQTCDITNLCSDSAFVLITFQAQGALPVTLTDFNAAYADDKVNLTWTSAVELNNNYYNVERSTDGNSFTTVSTVKGQGNSSIKHNYQFTDDVSKNLLNNNDLYYRLKQVDFDGKSTYTRVLVVRVYRTKTLQSLSVTPNPAINDIKVNVQLNENAYIVLKVANSSGIEVMRKTTRGSNGTNSLRLEGTSRLQAGVYFLEVIVNSNERMMVKLIKN